MGTHNVTLHIFYGIPCVGKSTTAVEFAYSRKIRTIIHSDYVREMQRHYVSPKQAPALAKVTHNAWQIFGSPTRENIEAGFIEHVKEVSVGTRTVVSKLVSDGFDAVIEGAHFHGDVINDLRLTHAGTEIHATLLIVDTPDELLHRITEKERARAQGAARKNWQENLPAMLAIQDFLIADAHTHGITVTTVDDWRRLWIPTSPDCSISTTSW